MRVRAACNCAQTLQYDSVDRGLPAAAEFDTSAYDSAPTGVQGAVGSEAALPKSKFKRVGSVLNGFDDPGDMSV